MVGVVLAAAGGDTAVIRPTSAAPKTTQLARRAARLRGWAVEVWWAMAIV
jgi:hypothetical protein